MDIDLTGIKILPEEISKDKDSFLNFKKDLNKWMDHFKNDNTYAIAHGKKGWGKDFLERKALDQALLPSNLDWYGVSIATSECEQIAQFLWGGEYKKIFADWLTDHDEPIEYLDDDNDPRVIKISELGREKFEKEGKYA
jgi:hypothetical protein